MCVLYIDMDGVIVDLNKTVIQELNIRYETHFKPEDNKDWWWSYTGMPNEVFEDILCTPYIFEQAYSIKGAIDNINKLKDYGFDIVFLTTPHYNSYFSMQEKVTWLESVFSWFNPYKNLVFAGRKGLVGSEEDVLIDDNIDNLRSFRGIKICFEQPWNKEWNGIKFANWDNLTDYLITLLSE